MLALDLFERPDLAGQAVSGRFHLRQRQVLLLEQPNQLDPRHVPLAIPGARAWRAGWREQALLDVEMNRPRGHARAFAQLGDIEVGHWAEL